MGYITLSNGIEIPDLCFGTDITYIHSNGLKRKYEELKCLVKMGLNRDKYYASKSFYLPRIINLSMENGCKMFDTSQAYGASEYTLGQVLKKYPRKDYVIVTKLCNSSQYNETVADGLKKSLDELGMEYIDVYLMHWPVKEHFIESWKQMEKLYKEGLCRAIGVCNFNIHHLKELAQYAEITPMINQIECHPLFTQCDLRDYCNEHNIRVMAYTSTARMDLRMKNTCLVPISNKYNKTVAQVILKWHQQIGNIPIVNSTNFRHMADNININNFELTQSEVEQILAININSRLRYDPDNCDFRKL